MLEINLGIYFKIVQTNHLTNRFKQCQKEIQDWKKSYEEEHIKVEYILIVLKLTINLKYVFNRMKPTYPSL